MSSDIARALKAVNIRIVANMQGRDTVAVEVPNANKEKVRLKELMSNAERFTYVARTIGGGIAVRDLVDRTRWMRSFRGANVYPIVTLSDTFMNTRFGGRQRPQFVIKRGVALGGEGALPPTGPPALSRPQIIEPPAAREALNDEIGF